METKTLHTNSLNRTNKHNKLPKLLFPKKTIGPVSDLERHLPADWWKSLFNSLYIKTDGDVVENQSNTEKDVDLIIKFGEIKKNDAVLDVCCGQGRHTLELARRGFTNVHGVDRSSYLIRLARKRAQNYNSNIKFSEGDARKLRLPSNSKNCVVLMGNSFGYFEKQEDDLAVLQNILRILDSKGKLILDIVNGPWVAQNFEPRSWEWIDQKYFVNRERTLSADKKRIIAREIITKSDVGIIADQFYAERLYSFEEIAGHLEQIGFLNVRNVAEVQSESTRMQDLGMMSNRLFICCEAPSKNPTVAVKSLKKNVTVILGDPRLPDPVKKNGMFNKEDLETIDKLKSALAELSDYQISYIDKHDNLLETLSKARPEFVFNLCDEGLKNDALMELHLPALLEILGVPYSGAAPGCLALCYDKHKVNAIAEKAGIPVPLESVTYLNDCSAATPHVYPAIMKPMCGDSSIGITQKSVIHNNEEMMENLGVLKKQFPTSAILVQEFLSGAEYTVGLIGNENNLEVLPILEVDYSRLPEHLPKLLPYESKWLPDSPYWTDIRYKQADISPEIYNKLVDHSKYLFTALNCRDYARFDYRCDDQGVPKLLEVNPNPGWCWDGKLNMMASLQGYSYSELLNLILKAAHERCEP